MRYSSRSGGRSRKPWSESVAIARLYRPAEIKLNAQILMLNLRRRRQLRRGAGPHHPAPLDQIMPVGDAGERRDVLVDHEDRLAGGLEPRQALPDLGANERRQAFGRLIED